MAYTIVNLDRMSGTEDSSQLVSVRFYNDTDEVEAIENGAIVVVGDYVQGSREVRKATTPTATTKISEIALIANPEVIYDESRYHGLEEYINEAGKDVRAFRFHNHDGFSLTKEGFSGEPAKGKYVDIGDGTTKLVISASASAKTIGKIDDVWTLGADTYYYIEVTL